MSATWRNLERLPHLELFFWPACSLVYHNITDLSVRSPRRRSLCSLAIMGTGKKEANRRERQGKTGDGMANVKVKGENFYR